ncbi:S-adenosyl-L-methionine-dependent methyltransferase [Cadophora sp. MPI-SDFR-AT-0126]|nr:S-adenosyl-L-methionine-dependent methyltransferase [Leotiomycetes sp. MPI-SDFR-AT-0126]
MCVLEKFYDILRSVNFDIKEAQLKVIALVRKPGQFIIPAGLLEVPFPTPPLSSPATPKTQNTTCIDLSVSSLRVIPSIEVQNQLTIGYSPSPQAESTPEVEADTLIDDSDEEIDASRPTRSSDSTRTTLLKRRAAVEDSDDENLSPACRDKRSKTFSNSSAPRSAFRTSEFKTKKVCGFLTTTDTDDSDEDKEPPRTANRRSITANLRVPPPRRQRTSHVARDLSSSLRDKPSFLNQSEVTLSSDEHSEDETENSTFLEEIKIRRPSCQRGFSNTPDFGYESEYEVPPENDELREISPEYWPSIPASRFKRHWSENIQEKQRLDPKSEIWVTPLIADLWKKYYPDSVEEVPIASRPQFSRHAKNSKDELQELRDQAEKHSNTSLGEVKLHNLIRHDRKLDRKYFAAAVVDGVRYVPGDYVMVASQGTEAPGRREGIEDSEVGSTEDPWFAQIIFIFQDEYEEKLVHLRWFEHGARTLLGETASSRELFLCQSCDDNPLGCIITKVEVEFIPDAAGYDVDSAEAGFNQKYHYFYRQYWHPESRSFTHIEAHRSRTTAKNDQGQADLCECCLKKAEKTAGQKTRIMSLNTVNNGRATISAFSLYETVYRLHDFVYVVDGQREVYEIGQITQIYLHQGAILHSKTKSREVDEKNISIRVSCFRRYDDLLPSFQKEVDSGAKQKVRDSRRLLATGAIIRVNAVDLDGKCYVLHRDHIEDLDSFKDQKDTFWVQERVSEKINPKSHIRLRDLRHLDSEDMIYSSESNAEFHTQMKRVQDFLKHGKKPRTLELFNGIGGLTVGFQDVCGKTNAVEIDEAACHTMRTNQPDSIVHHGDASLLLCRAIRRDQGEELEAIYDYRGNLIPDLPRRGDIDFIKGGPPCPGYSGANCHKRVGEARNGLVALFLSYVDFYQPKYSLMENVVGLIRHNLAVPHDPTDVEIKHGTIKMIFRTFTSMGYQVQCAILNAEEHGAPQSRPRVFIWATLPGYRLPEYPQPEYVYKSRADSVLFEPERKLGAYDFYWHRQRRSAPHRVVTLGDALTDLPAFDWKNPHQVVTKTQSNKREEQNRWARITLYDTFEIEVPFVGRNVQAYTSGPLTEYQRVLRISNTSNTVKNHVTAKMHALNVERVCSIPIRPGASYKDLPLALQGARNKPQKNACSRLDLLGIQNTCMTKMDVLGRYGKILHPTQHRIESVREYARVQGFPDSYVFDLENWEVGDAIRGIGNAVPIPLGRSVAGGFLDSWMEHVQHSNKSSDTTHAHDCNTGRSKGDAIDLVSDDDE